MYYISQGIWIDLRAQEERKLRRESVLAAQLALWLRNFDSLLMCQWSIENKSISCFSFLLRRTAQDERKTVLLHSGLRFEKNQTLMMAKKSQADYLNSVSLLHKLSITAAATITGFAVLIC